MFSGEKMLSSEKKVYQKSKASNKHRNALWNKKNKNKKTYLK